MRCNDQSRLRIGLLLDGELAARERDELVAHMAECADCASYRNELLSLRHQLRQLREASPSGLAHRLRARLEVEANEAPIETPFPRAGPAILLDRLGQSLRPYWRQALAMIAVAILSAATALWWAERLEDRQALAHDILAAHVRSLLQDNVVQVASLDTHTVKPWFTGRLDYTPVVKDLSADGFRLVGGRLDYVDGKRVAALVYMRRLHKINVFVWPAASDAGMTAQTRIEGYNIVSWTEANMTFWAISDLDATELGKLPGLI